MCERPPAGRFAPAAVPLCEGDTARRYSRFQRLDICLIEPTQALSVPLTEGDTELWSFRCKSLARGESPPWRRRGGCAINQMPRSLISRRRRGGSFKLPILRRLNEPPRPLQQGGFAAFLLMSRPPLLGQGGDSRVQEHLGQYGKLQCPPCKGGQQLERNDRQGVAHTGMLSLNFREDGEWLAFHQRFPQSGEF